MQYNKRFKDRRGILTTEAKAITFIDNRIDFLIRKRTGSTENKSIDKNVILLKRGTEDEDLNGNIRNITGK